jgi:glucosyl-dolichyl phosphate glucuronosyltransferase
MTASRPFVAVAICTFNRARLLRQTLESLTRLAVPPSLDWELVVVNNACTDDTEAVCASFGDRLRIRMVVERQPGHSRARNCALRSVDADYIVFTDDDVLLERRWLEVFVDAARRRPAAAAFGGPIAPNFPVEPEPDLLAGFPALATGFCGIDHGRDEGPLPATYEIYGANMAYRLDAVKGLRFDTTMGNTPGSQRGGEDIQFMNEVRARGGEVIWCPDMRVKHYVDPSRMTLHYLVSFYEDRGGMRMRHEGLGPSPSLFGTPTWLVRQTMEAYSRYLVSRLLASRAEAFTRLRDYCVLRGMLRECRTMRGRLASNDI